MSHSLIGKQRRQYRSIPCCKHCFLSQTLAKKPYCAPVDIFDQQVSTKRCIPGTGMLTATCHPWYNHHTTPPMVVILPTTSVLLSMMQPSSTLFLSPATQNQRFSKCTMWKRRAKYALNASVGHVHTSSAMLTWNTRHQQGVVHSCHVSDCCLTMPVTKISSGHIQSRATWL